MLYVIATPIGNLEDISLRAKRILSEVEVIACEDTRVTHKLLGLLELKAKKLIAFHDHNEQKQSEQLIRLMLDGVAIALVSDAGTPCIHDPGFRLVRAAHLNNIKVIPIPGCSAVTTFLSAVGVAGTKFYFAGYLPKKSGSLRAEIESWQNIHSPIIFFETAPRIPKSLPLITEIYPDGLLGFGRELTKMYEEIKLDKIDIVSNELINRKHLKGEFVFCLELSNKN